MSVQSFTNRPTMTPQASLVAKPWRQKPGVVKRLMPPPPPDEKTIRKLNALATQPPFCKLHRVKRHDTL